MQDFFVYILQDCFVIPCPRRGRVQQTKTKKSHLKVNFQMRFYFWFVIHAGFKPATPTSVVWYSIQLS